MSDTEPNYDDDGVPWCSEDCPSHDGKRCRQLGFRPDRICQIAVRDLVKKARDGRPDYKPPGHDWDILIGEAITDDVDAWQPSPCPPQQQSVTVPTELVVGSLFVHRDGKPFKILVIRAPDCFTPKGAS